jgi:RHH-type rel operon transcriptional repressor/antitoxin RelB
MFLYFNSFCDKKNTHIHSGDYYMATSIRLAAEIEQRLDFLAAHTGRTKAYYLREIIEQGIEELEDYYLAVDVLERIRKKQEEVYSAADVRRDIGLDD